MRSIPTANQRLMGLIRVYMGRLSIKWIDALFLVTTLVYGVVATAQTETPVFRFHASFEPAAVDPAAIMESTGGFLFTNLYRSLYRLDSKARPQAELAESCVEEKSESGAAEVWVCRLKKGLKFSNGESMTSAHWLKAWRRLIDPQTGSWHAEVLLPLQNAREILSKKKKPQELGVRARDEHTLEIRLDQADPDFLARMSLPVLTPIWNDPPKKREDYAQAVTTGPYRIKEWISKTRIRLEPNPFYFSKKTTRPQIELLILDEDSTALQMYDLGKINFLRRLNVKEIESRRKRKDFIFKSMYRFDYVGFGPALKDAPALREALQKSLNYVELTKAYLTPGEIGCPSLPKEMSTPWPCARFDLKAAKAALAQAKKVGGLPKMTLAYSKGGGEDVGRGMEWMQSQWKKHLGLEITLRPMESAMFWQKIKADPPALFRKGMNLSRPSCLAALEVFETAARDNAIGFSEAKFDAALRKLREAKTDKARKLACGEGLTVLVQDAHLIPLGELYFPMLAQPDFGGWFLTPLNQLDLTDLEPRPSSR